MLDEEHYQEQPPGAPGNTPTPAPCLLSPAASPDQERAPACLPGAPMVLGAAGLKRPNKPSLSADSRGEAKAERGWGTCSVTRQEGWRMSAQHRARSACSWATAPDRSCSGAWKKGGMRGGRIHLFLGTAAMLPSNKTHSLRMSRVSSRVPLGDRLQRQKGPWGLSRGGETLRDSSHVGPFRSWPWE